MGFLLVAGASMNLARRTSQAVVSNNNDGIHTQSSSLRNTAAPRDEKNRLTPIGETSIGRHGKKYRTALNGATKATPRPPLVKASSSPCENPARKRNVHSRPRLKLVPLNLRTRAAAAVAIAAANTMECDNPRWPRMSE